MCKTIERIKKEELKDIMRIQSTALKAIHDFMWSKGITQLMPVMLSPVTDPLAHPVHDSSILYGDTKLELTKSMILHKQVAMSRGDIEGIYIVSPNIRLESAENKDSGRHLIEFSQLDIELKGASGEEFRSFMEDLIIYVFSFVKEKCKEELRRIGREIKVPSKPFKIYDSIEMEKKYGKEFETVLSLKTEELFWITDLYREFYDKEDPESKKHLNYDLVYPEGFGEALSGAEREIEYEVIVRKMKEREMDLEDYSPYLEIAKTGEIKPTAGGGLGIERLIRFLSGKRHVKEVVLFPRVPGEKIEI